MNCWRFALSACWLLLGLATSRAGTLAQFRTIFGTIEVELYDQQKPATVQNFKRLVQSGAYQNTFFHRVAPGFVAQGGGYFAFNAFSTNLFGPPWSNLGAVPNFGNITNEYAVGPRFSNTNGTIAMAKAGSDPNSANCQWFFNLANNSANLDNQNGGFTVFGHVVRDANNVLPFFNAIGPTFAWVSLPWFYPTDSLATNLFTDLPVTYTYSLSAVPAPRYADLVYVDVSLLSVQITAAANQRQVSWNSVNGKTNLVEYATVMPPVWKTLATTNCTGARCTVSDTTPTNLFRFYRVRVLY